MITQISPAPARTPAQTQARAREPAQAIRTTRRETWGQVPDVLPGPGRVRWAVENFSSVPIEDIVADIMVPASTAVPASTTVPADINVRGDSCPSCGARLPAEGQPGHGIVVRASLPQPMAAALLATRTLSPRERTVFQFLGVGYDNRSIAHELGVSERTVKRHITLILAKLQLESRLQAGLTALILFSATNTSATNTSAMNTGAARPEGRMDPGRTPAETRSEWPDG